MYDTGGSYSVCHEHAAPDRHILSRLIRLRAEIERGERHARLFRSAREEREMLLMPSPVPTREAFAMLGRLLGLLPPAVIFLRLFRYGLDPKFGLFWFVMCLAMNAACCGVGRAAGAYFGGRIDAAERRSWPLTLLSAAALGLLWGLVTGGAGGFLFFGLGAFVGAALAAPVGVLAFLLFVPLHRLLARGGMIEERHLWPLACGTVGVIVATIISL